MAGTALPSPIALQETSGRPEESKAVAMREGEGDHRILPPSLPQRGRNEERAE